MAKPRLMLNHQMMLELLLSEEEALVAAVNVMLDAHVV